MQLYTSSILAPGGLRRCRASCTGQIRQFKLRQNIRNSRTGRQAAVRCCGRVLGSAGRGRARGTRLATGVGRLRGRTNGLHVGKALCSVFNGSRLSGTRGHVTSLRRRTRQRQCLSRGRGGRVQGRIILLRSAVGKESEIVTRLGRAIRICRRRQG